MPQDKDFKRLVRERMRTTGENYTRARAALAPVVLGGLRPEPLRWLRELGDKALARQAYERLQALPSEELMVAVVPGLSDANWRVRKQACALLDDVDFTAASLAGLTACLADEVPEVRRAAMHTLACQHCKPEGCVVDVRGVFERMRDDSSALVRSNVFNPLSWWELRHEDWSIGLLHHFADDKSQKIRSGAQRALEEMAERRGSDARRRALPEPLRSKTARHTGHWVWLDDGRIVGVDMTRKQRRHFPQAERFYVWPDSP